MSNYVHHPEVLQFADPQDAPLPQMLETQQSVLKQPKETSPEVHFLNDPATGVTGGVTGVTGVTGVEQESVGIFGVVVYVPDCV